MGTNTSAFASLVSHAMDAPAIGHSSREMQMLLFFHRLLCSNHDLKENQGGIIFTCWILTLKEQTKGSTLPLCFEYLSPNHLGRSVSNYVAQEFIQT